MGRRRQTLGLSGLGEVDLTGALYVGDPAVAEPVPAARRGEVNQTFGEARSIAQEVLQLEAAVAATQGTPEVRAQVATRVRQVEELARNLTGEMTMAEQASDRVEALEASLARKQAFVARLRSGLSGDPHTAIIPYLASNPPAWKAEGVPGFEDELRDGDSGVILKDPEAWVATSRWANAYDPQNVGSQQGTARVRPVKTRYFACPTGERWEPREFRVGSDVIANLIRTGDVVQVAQLSSEPTPGWTVVGGPYQRADPSQPLYCARGPVHERAPGGATINRSTGQVTMPPSRQIGVLHLQLTEQGRRNYHAVRYLEDGCPDKLWFCYEHNRPTGFNRFLSDAGTFISNVVAHPAFSAAAIVLTYGAATPFVAGAQGAATGVQAAQVSNLPSGLVQLAQGVQSAVPGLQQGSALPGLDPRFTGWGINAYVIQQAFTDPEGLSRDLARMIASGVLVPGFGPIAAIILPGETNRYLQLATAEAFYTVPGYASLVIHAEASRRRRHELRALLSRRQAALLETVAPILPIVRAVLQAAGSLLILTGVLAPVGLALQALAAATSIWEQSLQLEAVVNGLRAAYTELRNAGNEIIAGLDQTILDLETQIAAVNQLIEQLQQQRAAAGLPRLSEGGGGSSSGALVAAGVLAVAALAGAGNRRRA